MKREEKGARPGFEPGTSRTQTENHTPRPTSHLIVWFPARLYQHSRPGSRSSVSVSAAGKTIEGFRSEGTFKGHLARPLCHEQGHLPLDQVAQSSIRPGLECSQGWGISHLSGQPVTVPHHKLISPYIQSKSPSFSSKPLPLVLHYRPC